MRADLVDPGYDERAGAGLEEREQPASHHSGDVVLGVDGEDDGAGQGDEAGHDDERPAQANSVARPRVHQREDDLGPVAGRRDDVDLLGGVELGVLQPQVHVRVDADAEDVDDEDGAEQVDGPRRQDLAGHAPRQLLHRLAPTRLHPADGTFAVLALKPLRLR